VAPKPVEKDVGREPGVSERGSAYAWEWGGSLKGKGDLELGRQWKNLEIGYSLALSRNKEATAPSSDS